MKSTVLSSNASSWLKGCNNSTAEQKGWIPKWIMCVHSRIQIKTLRHGQKWIMAPQWRKDRCSASRMSTTMWRLLAVCHVVANTPRGRSWRTSGEFSSQISIQGKSPCTFIVFVFSIFTFFTQLEHLCLYSQLAVASWGREWMQSWDQLVLGNLGECDYPKEVR